MAAPKRGRARRWIARGLMISVTASAAVLGCPATAPSQPPTLRIRPTADAYVSAARPRQNFGSARTLRIGSDDGATSYLRFRVHGLGGAVRRATLRVMAATASRTGFTVRAVDGGRWREHRITYRRAPGVGQVLAAFGTVHAGEWLTIDVTGAVTADGSLDLALASRGRQALAVYSREAGQRRAPRLVISASGSQRSQADPVIAAAGDIACDPLSADLNGGRGAHGACQDRVTAALLARRDLAAVLTLGDNQYEDGRLSAFRTVYDRTWGRVKGITHPAVGNHEYRTPGATGYFDYFNGVGQAIGPAGERGKGYYSFDIGAWHLIALNSNCDQVGGCESGSPQERWLQADLAAHASLCTLAYWHHPRFSSGQEGTSSRVAALWQDLYDAGADLVLVGHAHDYERFAPQDPTGTADPARGIREIVVGTGGKRHYGFLDVQPNSAVRNADTWGVVELTLHATGYDWRFVPEAGGWFTDAGSAPCH
jgi:acid phosphatase type 7